MEDIEINTLKKITLLTGFMALLSVGFFGASAVLANTPDLGESAQIELAVK